MQTTELDIRTYVPQGDPTKQPYSLCLVMIVRDEEDTIRRCLTSVSPYISYWVIVDTGSNDKTKEVIKETMEELGIPGELHERPWVNFEVNRTESLQLAKGKCDFRWIIDADDTFVVETPGINPFYVLDKEFDSFHVFYKIQGLAYYRIQIVRSDEDWVYKGVLHEYLDLDKKDQKSAQIPGAYVKADVSPLKRAGSIEEKYSRDAEILEEALEKEPDNTRYMFYLAQSYRDSGQNEKALEAYSRRVQAGGWAEEVYYSMYMIGRLKDSLGHPPEEVIDALVKAWEFRPERLEAVYCAMRKLREQGRFLIAVAYGEMALQRGLTGDILFIESEIWEWRFLDELSICSFYIGKVQSAIEKAQAILNSPSLPSIPEGEIGRIRQNLETFKTVIPPNKILQKGDI